MGQERHPVHRRQRNGWRYDRLIVSAQPPDLLFHPFAFVGVLEPADHALNEPGKRAAEGFRVIAQEPDG